MITVVRAARALVILVLASVTVSTIVGIATPGTGPVEKGVLLGLIVGCVYAAARVSALAEWAIQRLTRAR